MVKEKRLIKAKTLGVRMSKELKKDVEDKASKKGLSPSDYVRFLILKDLEK